MSDMMFCTEKEVRDMLIGIIGTTDEAPKVFVAFRNQPSNALKRMVTFVIQTEEGNETLVNKLVKFGAEHDNVVRFDKSEMIVQDGRFTVDFLYVEAVISPNLA